jgi:S1/P1 Nuclease
MRRCFAVLLLLLVPSSLYAWGNTGHRVVARIAQDNLTDEAAAEVDRLLHHKSLASIASVPDQIRNKRPETAGWHFVDIPIDRDFDAAQDCKDHDCVIDQINAAKATLADRSKSDADRKDALIFLTHLVGDAHQPLHCSTRVTHGKSDKGGNLLSVHFAGDTSNFHKVFDSGLIEQEELNESDLVDFLTGDVLGDRDPASLTSGTPEEWADDAHNLGKAAYQLALDKHKNLDDEFVDTELKVVDDQLLKAGLRLARLINEALGAS